MQCLRMLAPAAAAACLGLAGCGGGEGGPETGTSGPAPRSGAAVVAGIEAGYVDDRKCGSCHRSIWQSYQHVGMSKSLYPWTPQNAIEDFQNNHFHHEPSNRHYEMNVRDDRLVFARYQLDTDGRRVNRFERAVDWVVGSGNNARTYLYQEPSGELFELPLTWYSKDGVWAMSPGYDTARHFGISRSIGRDCMFCHNAYPDLPAGGDRFGRLETYPASLPHGIGCQRCHGPGSEHVRLAADLDTSLGALRESIFNPARQDPGRRPDDVCMQCHMQPASKLDTLVRRFGTPTFSYRPDTPLREYLLHVDFDADRTRHESFEINHHAYRMQQSVCFEASDGALNCLTCHDPHSKVPREDVQAYYRSRCLGCHQLDDCAMDAMQVPAGTRPGDCITCHMPKRRPHDVPHAIVTDHRIQLRPPPGDLLALFQEHEPDVHAGAAFYRVPGTPAPVEDPVYLATARVKSGNLDAIGQLQSAIEQSGIEAVEPRYLLGVGLLRAGRPGEAAAALQRALEIEPGLPAGHANLSVALAALNKPKPAVEHGRRAVELDPRSAEYRSNLANLYLQTDRLDEAQQLLDEAVRLRPTLAGAHMALGNLQVRRGRFAEAAGRYRQVLAIEPRHPAACRNLAAALRRTDQWPEAIRVLRHGAADAPDQPLLHTELAIMLLLAPDPALRNPDRGAAAARRAVALAPNHPRARLAVALAALLNGRPADALVDSEQAIGHRADPVACLLIQAVALDQIGNRPEARRRAAQARGLLLRSGASNFVRDALLAMTAHLSE